MAWQDSRLGTGGPGGRQHPVCVCRVLAAGICWRLVFCSEVSLVDTSDWGAFRLRVRRGGKQPLRGSPPTLFQIPTLSHPYHMSTGWGSVQRATSLASFSALSPCGRQCPAASSPEGEPGHRRHGQPNPHRHRNLTVPGPQTPASLVWKLLSLGQLCSKRQEIQ